MPSLTWTPEELASEAVPWQGAAWRLVEAQHVVSTLKLVDDVAQQQILERLIDDTKPAFPAECSGLDYLMATPFRYYPVNPYGSRFRRAGAREGVFYCACLVDTAVAEMAFYRLLFFAESPGLPASDNAGEYTAFQVRAASRRTLDLTKKPLSRDETMWRDPTNYEPCQELARLARLAEVEIIAYSSVRDGERRKNLALLNCTVFTKKTPVNRQTWRIQTGSRSVEAICEFPRRALSFPFAHFRNDPRLSVLLNG